MPGLAVQSGNLPCHVLCLSDPIGARHVVAGCHNPENASFDAGDAAIGEQTTALDSIEWIAKHLPLARLVGVRMATTINAWRE
jgi:hypothetical protein